MIVTPRFGVGCDQERPLSRTRDRLGERTRSARASSSRQEYSTYEASAGPHSDPTFASSAASALCPKTPPTRSWLPDCGVDKQGAPGPVLSQRRLRGARL